MNYPGPQVVYYEGAKSAIMQHSRDAGTRLQHSELDWLIRSVLLRSVSDAYPPERVRQRLLKGARRQVPARLPDRRHSELRWVYAHGYLPILLRM